MREKDVTVQTLRVYDAEYKSFLDRWGKGPYKPPPLLLELMEKIPPKARILDLGCGLAQDTRHLIREGYRATGLDLSERLLGEARKKSGETPLIRADLIHLPIQKESFAAVWSAAVLVHFPKNDGLKIMRAVRLCLGAKGLFAGTFTFGTRSGISRRGWLPGRFFSRWKKEELAQTLRHAGFEIETLAVVSNRERKGRWLNLIARKKGTEPSRIGRAGGKAQAVPVDRSWR